MENKEAIEILQKLIKSNQMHILEIQVRNSVGLKPIHVFINSIEGQKKFMKLLISTSR